MLLQRAESFLILILILMISKCSLTSCDQNAFIRTWTRCLPGLHVPLSPLSPLMWPFQWQKPYLKVAEAKLDERKKALSRIPARAAPSTEDPNILAATGTLFHNLYFHSDKDEGSHY